MLKKKEELLEDNVIPFPNGKVGGKKKTKPARVSDEDEEPTKADLTALEEEVVEDDDFDEYLANSNYVSVMNQFRRDAGDMKILTPEEELALTREYRKTHDKRIAERIEKANYRLVLKIVCSTSRRNGEFEDCFQEGCIGLHKALERYDPDLGFRFSTYATWWIRQSIQRYTENTENTIRIPVHVLGKMRRLEKWKVEFSKENGRYPTEEETMKQLGKFDITKSVYKNYMEVFNTVSLNTAIIGSSGDEEGTELGDFITAPEDVENDVDHVILRETLDRIMNTVLTDREKFVIQQRFYENLTLEAVGKKMGVTRERIRQIEVKAIRKLRNPKRSKELKDLMDIVVR